MLNEEYTLNQLIKEEGTRMLNKHHRVFESIVNRSPIFSGKHGIEFSTTHASHLGKMLEWGQNYDKAVHENASASDMGQLPLPSIDLLAAHYAISIAPLFCSMQVLPARQGIVYFKQVLTSGMVNAFPYTNNADPASNGLGSDKFGPQARGGVNPGTQLVDARRGWVGSAVDYATEQVMNEDISGGISSGAINTQVRMFPVRRNMPVRITATDGSSVYEGTFLNVNGSNARKAPLMTSSGWATGEIDFATGVIELVVTGSLNLTGANVSYMQDFETAADNPTIESSLTTMPVQAEYMVIKQLISTFKQFEMKQTLGKDADADALMDLAGTMADIESQRIIRAHIQLANLVESTPESAGRPIEFDMAVPVGVAEYQYRQGIRYTMAELDASINRTSGKGAANRYLAGHKMGVFLSALPDYEAAPANIPVGPHVLGYYQGKPIVRTRYLTGYGIPVGAKGDYGTGSTVDPDNVLISSYLNPGSAFDAAVVAATYMPLFVTEPSQIGYNMLQNARVIAACKAFTPVVQQYVKGASLYNSAA